MKKNKIFIMLFLANIINISSTQLTKDNKTKIGINKLIFTNNFPEKQIFNKLLLNTILKQAFQGKPMQKIYNCSECPSIFQSKQGLENHKSCHFSKQYNHYHNQLDYSYNLDTSEDDDSSSDFDDQIFTEYKRKNNDEKPFKCDYPKCNYVSNYKSNLTRHKKIHRE